MRKRVIPVLQISGGKLVKTRCFRNPRYVGDPINAVKIFNEKGVDELVLLDISATAAGREPDYDLIRDIASEAFMPLCYGGGITRIDQMRRLFATGIEKIAVNHAALTTPELLRAAAAEFGSQSVVASVNVKRDFWFRRTEYVFDYLRMRTTRRDPRAYLAELEAAGAGEILVTSVDRDGMMNGYDVEMIRQLAAAVQVPLIALGGAGSLDHVRQVLDSTEASAAAAGSLFVFQGPHRAVLIQYPTEEKLKEIVRDA